ncbi:MAG: hypothetical protein NTW87_08845 [Planctomycetota bacterium]|nr:hypothetical protein [Planctomycetota bacterium]
MNDRPNAMSRQDELFEALFVAEDLEMRRQPASQSVGQQAVRASLDLIDGLVPDNVVFPLLAACAESHAIIVASANMAGVHGNQPDGTPALTQVGTIAEEVRRTTQQLRTHQPATSTTVGKHQQDAVTRTEEAGTRTGTTVAQWKEESPHAEQRMSLAKIDLPILPPELIALAARWESLPPNIQQAILLMAGVRP